MRKTYIYSANIKSIYFCVRLYLLKDRKSKKISNFDIFLSAETNILQSIIIFYI